MSDDFLEVIRDRYKDRIICVASPSPEMTDYRYNVSMIEMIGACIPCFQMRLQKAVSSRIALNRNNIVRDARNMGATDIMWIDSDTKFPNTGLLRLLQHDKDIVCATTCRRDLTGTPVGLQLEAGIQAQLIKMKLVGFPFMLTKVSVFNKWDELWPEHKGCYFAEPPRWVFSEIGDVEDNLIAEDEYFCHFIRKAGFDIWCDMELSTEIGHIGSTVNYIGKEFLLPAPAKVDEVLA